MHLKIFILILFSLNSFASTDLEKIKKAERENRLEVIGTIIKIEGKATIIDELNRVPTPVKLNQKIYNDSSIYCENNSYVTIDLKNKFSYLKLGQATSLFFEKKKKELELQLNQGFVKVLFKSSAKLRKLSIKTKNAKTTLKNNKTLIVYSPLVKRTSLINYKGHAKFESLFSISEPAVKLPPNHYSYISKKMRAPKEIEKLSRKRKRRLLDVFKVDAKI